MENPQPNVQVDQKQERMWSMLCHLAALAGLIIPFGNILGPLVVWLIKKDEYPAVDANGKESLNFQISMLIYTLVGVLLCLIFIGIVVIIGLAIANVVLVIIASIKVNNGETYKYPITIKLIK